MNDLTPSTPKRPRRKTLREQRVARAIRRSLLVGALGAVFAAAFAVWVNWSARPRDNIQAELILPDVRQIDREELPSVTFADVTREAGITFVHQNGATGQKLLPETMGSGCALADFDQDGDQDLLLINSTYWPSDPRSKDRSPPTMAVYRNDTNWQFVDVTKEVGLDVSFYGMGAAVGDMDNDGDLDLFVSAVGANHLFRNDGKTFTDITQEAGVSGADNQWSSGCAWFDFNNDHLLDLFVCNYIQWSREHDLAQDFTLDGSSRAYGPPVAFGGAFPYLYRNNGDGTFTEVSKEMGLQIANSDTDVAIGKSLGLAPIDLDRDGWMDIIVANDTVQNFVFHNDHGESFREIGTESGVAFDSRGRARGAMGIDTACFRDDETTGIVIGNFANEMTALYVSMGDPLQFFDAAITTGIGPASRLELTFGIFFWDYDLDGRLDLLAANGHLEQNIQTVQESQTYEQPPRIFWNAGPDQESEFVRVPEDRCGDMCRPMVGRGSAFADLDGDGDLDVLITANGHAPRLLRNDQQLGHHWIRLRLVGRRCNRDAIGARIELHAAGRVLRRTVMPTRSYLSQSELPITFGLAGAISVDRIIIHWPGGAKQQVSDLTIDQLHVIQQEFE